MMIGELCTRDVVVTGRDESVLTAARLMREHHVGDVVVVEERGGRRVPVGILTDRDIVLEVMALEVPPEAVTAGDTMSAEPVTMSADADLVDATALMRERGVRRLLVVDDEQALVGILTVDDVLDVVAEEMNNIARLLYRQREHEASARRLS